MSYGIRTFGLTATTRTPSNEKDENERAEEKEDEEQVGDGEVVSGWYAKNLKLSRRKGCENVRAREREREREEVDSGGVTGNRKRAPAYNLKTHSAFKLLTMAAGYKVLCLCHDEEARVGGGSGNDEPRFKSLIYLRGDCGRHDGATAGRSGADSRWGKRGKRKKNKNKREEAYFAAGISAPSHVRHFSWGTPRCVFCPAGPLVTLFLLPFSRDDISAI